MRVDKVVPFDEASPSTDGYFWRCHNLQGTIYDVQNHVTYIDGERRCFFAPPQSPVWPSLGVMAASVAALVLALMVSAHAEPLRRQCAGLLHADRDGELYFEVPPAGLCKIVKTERAKVLGRCRVNSMCHVEGIAENCKDQAECSEVLQILSAARGQ